ncbi:hypothetical protein P691DRAFT_806327 [Macrolepiota fuliginosa MF-IS2]|uniref:Uncharacterized protein n=1 Tax=Macrolepiota fuliginosa MF-IS2 TaxID=1400762 RepID=A0A9P5X0X8_9AGAR|nr:hypothetical protein P691DRAFT_811587 [Macrolepiota fuliginosa MF-IS2]KAF9445006.1 hypothetical protein P691DRAFT_806327 [Macrolepiota fuliginosa MF-IS2]
MSREYRSEVLHELENGDFYCTDNFLMTLLTSKSSSNKSLCVVWSHYGEDMGEPRVVPEYVFYWWSC